MPSRPARALVLLALGGCAPAPEEGADDPVLSVPVAVFAGTFDLMRPSVVEIPVAAPCGDVVLEGMTLVPMDPALDDDLPEDAAFATVAEVADLPDLLPVTLPADAWTGAAPLRIEGGTQTTIPLVYRPDEEGTHEVVVQLRTATGTQEVQLSAAARRHLPQVVPYLLDFGFGHAGRTQSFQVDNRTRFQLPVSLQFGEPTDFVAIAAPTAIDPLTRVEVVVRYDGGEAPAKGHVLVSVGDEPVRRVQLVANDCAHSISVDVDQDGVSLCGGDCDDDDPDVRPGAPERANGLDDDCDGVVDEVDVIDASVDADQDGVSALEGDCNDRDPSVSPQRREIPNGRDDDCDGFVDEGSLTFDDDGDGLTERQGDCDDSDPDIRPGAVERLNELDDDCDGLVDEAPEPPSQPPSVSPPGAPSLECTP
ncbi:MAG: putative metal-binding motif-containing protein [Alphaproteobacteria bacterium]|nr:putative metal-binding motif-containing protein [Alphaproteobacteria bacterium]